LEGERVERNVAHLCMHPADKSGMSVATVSCSVLQWVTVCFVTDVSTYQTNTSNGKVGAAGEAAAGHANTHTNTHTHTHTHAHTLSLSPSLSLTFSLPLSLFLSPSLALSPSLTHTHTHTRACTHTHSLNCSAVESASRRCTASRSYMVAKMHSIL